MLTRPGQLRQSRDFPVYHHDVLGQPSGHDAAIRQYLAEHPDHFDPRQYLKPARENMKKMYIHKIVNVLGSDGKLG